jgi:hypothetical protein
MDDLTNDELKQLVNFYRQKSTDLEFQILQFQLKTSRPAADDVAPASKKEK